MENKISESWIEMIANQETKNFLLADTERGAEARARVFSEIETAKMNGLDVYGYLVFLLSELPKLGKEPTRE